MRKRFTLIASMAAIVAAARWSCSAALHRRESRGMHRREDAPETLPAFARRQLVSGLDQLQSSFQGVAAPSEASA